MSARIEALKQFVGVDETEIEEVSWRDNCFEVGSKEYLVLTDEEADVEVKEYIRESLWAFNLDFISRYCDALDNFRVKESLRKVQEQTCEDCNELVYALVKDNFETVVNDAIMEDGRGHFLATYDSEETQTTVDGVEYFIYRMS
jgi:uncharacterized protein with PIN domain